MGPERRLYDNLGLILGIAALMVLLILVLISLTILSKGALTQSIAALHRGESRVFSSAFRAGLSNFWRMLGQRVLLLLISLVLSLVIFVPVVLLFLVLFSSADPESIGLMFLLVFLGLLLAIPLLILVLVPVYIIGQLALRELVLAGNGSSVR